MMIRTETGGARRRWGRITAVAAASALTVTGLAVAEAPAVAADASNTLVVHAAQPFRPVTHVASGSLYGLADDASPSDDLARAIKPNTFVQMAAGGKQQPKGDVAVVQPKAARVGAKVVDRFADWYTCFYCYDASTWQTAIQTQVTAMKGKPNLAAYAIWNESDNTWNATQNGETYESFWTHSYRSIRALDATTPIQGPSFSDNIDDMENFLTNAKNTNTVPDVLAWHELIRQDKIVTDLQKVDAIRAKLGISARPIDIEEYGSPQEVGIPGKMIGYISKFERLGIARAELAFWNGYGTLGDTLTGTGGSPNGAYWLYRWYAQMTGDMVSTVPPTQTGIDGAASVTSDKKELDVILGGGTSGSAAVTIDGLGALSLGGTVNVKLEYTPSPGRTVAVAGPTTVSTSTYTVSNGAITVPITMDPSYGYHIVVTPGAPENLAGTYTVANANSGLLLGETGTAWGSTATQQTANSTTAQRWTLRSAGSNRYLIVNQASGLVLGIANAGTGWGDGALVWGDTGTDDHLWRVNRDSSGRFRIVNANSGLVLGITGASTAAGARAPQWGDTGTADHLWTLTKL